MKDEQQNYVLPKRLGLMWRLAIAAIVGAAAVAGAKMGFRKLVGWAREGKPEPKGLYDALGDAPLYGALGAVIGTASSYEHTSNKDKENLAADNLRLQQKIDQITSEKWTDSLGDKSGRKLD